MSTPTSGDLLLVNRGGVNYQIDYDDMSTLQDTDLLLVNRAGVNYQIAASDLDLGPDGLIVPSVDVLTPVNGAGLDEGTSYTPLSSAYVSTDSTPIYYRYFPETITTVAGTWTDENNLFNGQIGSYASIAGGSDTPQFVYTNLAAHGLSGESVVTAYCGSSGGTIEVIDENDQVLRTYDLPFSSSDANTSVGIVRADNKIRVTGAANGTTVYISIVVIGDSNQNKYDYVISGRVAFEFTDDTDLDKMIAPIIQVDANGNVKVPTTSTVDSTTTIPGENKSLHAKWVGDGTTKTFTAGSGTDNTASGARMSFVKENNSKPGLILDTTLDGYLYTSNANGKANYWTPLLNENESEYRTNNGQINNSGKTNYVTEIGVAPKVLDIVSYEGDGNNNREIPHNLGTKPGMILVKATDTSANWMVFHVNRTPGKVLNLDEQFSETTPHDAFPSEPTSTNFYVGTNVSINGAGHQYVAYVFPADSPGKVKCGSYYGNGAITFLDVGFQAGFVLIKRKNGSADWIATNEEAAASYKYWNPNREDNQFNGSSGDYIGFGGATEISLNGGNTDFNASGGEYVYLAIASDLNGPNSTQLNLLSGQDLEYFTTGTQITSNLAASGSNVSFASTQWPGAGNTRNISPQADSTNFFNISYAANNKWLVWIKSYSTSNGHNLYDSERGLSFLSSQTNNPEIYNEVSFKGPVGTTAYQVSYSGYTNEQGSNYISWNFLGAPQFFDVQKYTGNDVSKSISHDLGVEPGCIIIKGISGWDDWYVYHHETGLNKQLRLNTSSTPATLTTGITGATSTDFSVGSYGPVNSGNKDFIAYLFAKDTPYVKCGTYTGTGASQLIVDVGFKPRWILIKDTSNAAYDWVIFDKNRPGAMLRPNMQSEEQTLAFSFVSNGLELSNGQNSAWVNNSDNVYVYVAIADETEGHPPSAPSSSTVTATPDPNTATMIVNAESFDVGDTASAPALEASITSLAGAEGNTLLVDGSTGTWMPGLYAKGSETTASAPSADEIVFTSSNAGTTPFTGVDATLSSRTWTLESSSSATGPWTVVDTYVDYDVLASQDGATPWTSNKPALAADTFYRVKVQYNSTNAESVESVYSTFKTSA